VARLNREIQQLRAERGSGAPRDGDRPGVFRGEGRRDFRGFPGSPGPRERMRDMRAEGRGRDGAPSDRRDFRGPSDRRHPDGPAAERRGPDGPPADRRRPEGRRPDDRGHEDRGPGERAPDHRDSERRPEQT